MTDKYQQGDVRQDILSHEVILCSQSAPMPFVSIALIGTVTADDTSFRVGALANPNTSYTFTIAAVFEPKSGGEAVESKVVKVQAKTTKFLAPKFVSMESTLTSITIYWHAPDADGFIVTCMQDKMPIVLDFEPGGNATYLYEGGKIVGATFTGLPIGLKYDFTIVGTNSVLSVKSAALRCSWNPNQWPRGFYAFYTQEKAR